MTDPAAGLNATRIDYVAAGLRGVVGAVPYAGGLLAEIVGTLIPNQRLDRLVSFGVWATGASSNSRLVSSKTQAS